MKKPTPCIRFNCKVAFHLLCAYSFFITGLQAQVNARVDYLRDEVDSTEILQVWWALEDEQEWHVRNDGRLDIMGLVTEIYSEELNTSSSGSTQYQFDFPSSSTIELLVDITRMAQDEKLYLWDTKHRVILYDIGVQKKKRFLTPAFDPSQTVLIWTSQRLPSYQSLFTIDHIYYDASSTDRSSGIGFGTALPCHPNTACKQDSILQLIANSAVRIRLVMDEGIGWCTGSFINNARRDKTPYLLTAYHCQYEFTPFYDMWRFDLQYKSGTCLNPPLEPQYFSITGCELKALGQASDFLLVQVTGQIPLNQPMTFAGWDKEDATAPDTTYLIHHPNADIRKISSCVNDAVIHPNQIGWSEGYTTPANHHFRLKFTEGGHEPGSSGGPIFNEKGFLVGQLHGGTAGCEEVNTAYIGRISKSWNLGPSSQERLRDWLDPDDTGLASVSSIENINSDEIVDIHGIIKDPEGRPVKNAIIKITGSIEQSLTTNEEGTFLLPGVNRNGQYTITPEKKVNPLNGLSAIDLLAIQKHLLAKDTFDFPWQYIAADATNNQQITVGDIVVLLRLLLGKIQTLPSSPSWRFDPPLLVIDPLPAGEPDEVQITGIKIGDVNGQRIQINKVVTFHSRSNNHSAHSKNCLPAILLVAISIFISSCAGNRLLINTDGPAVEPIIPGEPVFTVYALGDAGTDNGQSKAVLGQIASLATDDHHPGMILFLGDNIYPAGFASPTESAEHNNSKTLLKRQTDTLGAFAGQIIFIPGNHDWNEFKAGGLEAIRRQGEFLKSLHDPRIRLLPVNGCSGPVALQLGDDAVMLILDSQWWFQDWEKEPGMNEGCEVQTREQLKEKIHTLVVENKDKQIILALHHPLYSQGNHGGHFSFRDHVFPLTKIVPWLWFPLPIIGSIYPGYRSLIGHPQDLPNPKYKSLKETILEGLEYDGELIFLSGHEHNLQYIRASNHHQIISGSGAHSSQVADGRQLVYGHRAAGFVELNFYSNHSIQLTVYEVNESSNTHAIILRQTLAPGLNP